MVRVILSKKADGPWSIEAGRRWNVHFLATVQFFLGSVATFWAIRKKNWNPEISSDIADLCPIYSCVFTHVFHMCFPIDTLTFVPVVVSPRVTNPGLCPQDFGKSRVHFCGGAQTFSAFWWWLSTPGHRLELFFFSRALFGYLWPLKKVLRIPKIE